MITLQPFLIDPLVSPCDRRTDR